MEGVVVAFIKAANPGHNLVVNVISLPLGVARILLSITWASVPQLSRIEGRAKAPGRKRIRLRNVAVNRIGSCRGLKANYNTFYTP